MTMASLILTSLMTLAYAVTILPDYHLVVQEPYVTVSSDGSADTITPIATTVQGVMSTLSPIPEFLTKTRVYTLTNEDGHVSTATGTRSVASATSGDGAGAFMQCDNYQGVNGPFCSPHDGAHVELGGTYYITWDPRWFSSADETVRVQGSYFESGLPDNIRGTTAFISDNITAERGFYAWTVDEEKIFTNRNITLSLSYVVSDSATTDAIKGPTIKVVKAGSIAGSYDDNETNMELAIGLPIALVGLSAIFMSCWQYFRKRSSVALSSFSSIWPGRQGYGIRQSRSQRIGASRDTKMASTKSVQLQNV